MKFLVRRLEIIEKGEWKILPLHYIELKSEKGQINELPAFYPYVREEAGVSLVSEAKLEIGTSYWEFNIVDQ